jgi:hypothetical protein
MTTETQLSIDPYRRTTLAAPNAASQDFGFEDLLDVVNPLQHLPGIGWLYRELSGDMIKPPAAIAGGALFGGPLGFAGAILSAAFESLSGETPEGYLARLASPNEHGRAATAYARASALAGS